MLVAKKDYNLPKHNDIDTKNLYVVKACQSLTSRGYVKTQFSWQYYYYTLTPEGLDYLREWLHLPAEIVPATHIKQQRSHAPPRGMMGGDGDRPERKPFGGRGGRGGDRGDRGDREGGYRRRDAGEGKDSGAPGEFAPSLYVSTESANYIPYTNKSLAVVWVVDVVVLLHPNPCGQFLLVCIRQEIPLNNLNGWTGQ